MIYTYTNLIPTLVSVISLAKDPSPSVNIRKYGNNVQYFNANVSCKKYNLHAIYIPKLVKK